MVPPCAWLSKWVRVEGAASSFAAELAREIVHGRSFRALAFANHMENGREVFWKMGRVVGVADGGSSADRCVQASWSHCDMRCRIRRLHAAFWLVGAHEKHVKRLGRHAGQVVRKTRRADRSESSPIRSFGRAIERALRAREVHLAENAARGPRCGARILRVLGQFVMDDSLTCGFPSWQERAFPDMVERPPHSLSNEAP